MPNHQTQNSVISVDEIPAEGSTAFLLQAAPKLPGSTLTYAQNIVLALKPCKV